MRRSLQSGTGTKFTLLVFSTCLSCSIAALLPGTVKEYPYIRLKRSSTEKCGSHAVVFSGSIAGLKRKYGLFEANILGKAPASADIFAHVYSDAKVPDHREGVRLLSNNRYVKGLVVETWDKRVVNSILQFFGDSWACYLNATATRYEEVPGGLMGRKPDDFAMRVLSNFRKMYLANELQRGFRTEHGCDYSYVLRLRADLSHTSALRIPPLEPRTVYVPDFDTHSKYDFKVNRSKDLKQLNDQMVLGLPEEMDALMSFYPKLPTLCREIGVPHPETVMRAALNSASLNAVYLNHQYELDNREKLGAVVNKELLEMNSVKVKELKGKEFFN